MFNYNHLYYFYTCAHFKSISKGALYLKTSQPSLSIQIKTLEAQLGVTLFERNGRNLEMSESGKIIFSFCEKMFAETENIAKYLQTKSLVETPTISIGVSEQIERPFIADIIGELIKKFRPKKDMPKMRMESLDLQEMFTRMRLGKLDLLISHDIQSSKGLEHISLDIPVALVGQKKYLNASGESKQKIISFLRRYNEGIVAPVENFKLRTETDLFCSMNDINLNIVFETSNLAANVRAISEGLGIGFMPLIYVAKDLKDGRVAYLMPPGGFWVHTMHLYYSGDALEKSGMEELLNLFKLSVRNLPRS